MIERPPTKRRTGPVERATRADLRRLPAGPLTESLGALAIALARNIDADPGLAFAKVSKELRDTLAQLAEGGNGEHPFSLDDLSTPLRDPQDGCQGNVRTAH